MSMLRRELMDTVLICISHKQSGKLKSLKFVVEISLIAPENLNP